MWDIASHEHNLGHRLTSFFASKTIADHFYDEVTKGIIGGLMGFHDFHDNEERMAETKCNKI